MSDWLPDDIAARPMPPTVVACEPRSPEALEAVVALAGVATTRRYQPRPYPGAGNGMQTYCNIFVSDVTRWLGCEVPHQVGGVWQDVRGNADWLRGEHDGWRKSTAAAAQAAADAGRPAVVLWDPPQRSHGHIALLVPSHGEGGVWIAQAGASCFSRGRLVHGFGQAAPLEWFEHD